MQGDQLTLAIPIRHDWDVVFLTTAGLENLGYSRTRIRLIHDRDDPPPASNAFTCWPNQFSGFGGAVRTAIAQCETEWLALVMADGCDDLSALATMQMAANDNALDIAIGSRFVPGGSLVGQSRIKLSLVRSAAWLSRTLADVSDPSNNFRLYRVEALRKLSLTETTPAIAVEILAEASRAGLVIGEVAAQWREQRHRPSARYLRYVPHYTKHFVRYMLNTLRG